MCRTAALRHVAMFPWQHCPHCFLHWAATFDNRNSLWAIFAEFSFTFNRSVKFSVMEFPCLVVKITWYSSKLHSLNCRQKPSSPRWVCSGVQSCPGPSPMKTATEDLLGSTIFYFNANYLKKNYLTECSFIDLILLWKQKEEKSHGPAQGLVSFEIIDDIKSQTKRGGRCKASGRVYSPGGSAGTAQPAANKGRVFCWYDCKTYVCPGLLWSWE